MNKQFRPMLAYSLQESDLESLQYPLILQSKLDGIRCLIVEGRAVSRKLKPIPNKYIRDILESLFKDAVLIDGELIIEGASFNSIQSDIMSKEGKPKFIYKVFDCLLEWNSTPYKERLKNILYAVPHTYFIEFLNYIEVYQLETLLEYEAYILKDGYEGIILRSPNAPYKFGRSTLKEQSLLKFKRFQDSEAVILSSHCLMNNCNILETDNLGYAKRSSAQSNLTSSDMLGSFICKDINKESPFYNIEFNLGSGFTEEQRIKYWKDREQLEGKIIVYKYQKYGSLNKPRMPIFKGFRKD